MIKRVKGSTLAAVMATVMMLNGCTSYNAVKVSNKPLGNSTYFLTEPPLYAGDKIRYQLKDGRKGEMTVDHLTANAIVGQNGVTLPASELSALERQDISGAKTGAAVGGGVAVTMVVVVVVIFSSMMAVLFAGG